MKVQILHFAQKALGTEDRMIPRRDALTLFEAAPAPKTWIDVAGGHNQVFDGPEFSRGLARFLEQTLECSREGVPLT